MLEVDADLVRAPGVQRRLDIGGRREAFEHAEAGPRLAPFAGGDGHAFAVRRVPRDGGLDVALVVRHDAGDEGAVELHHRAFGELLREREVGLVVLGHEQAAARVLVEAVDDARPGDPADPAELSVAMMEEGVDEGVLVMADGRMHHDAGRFVEHEHVGVLVEDLQRNVLRQRFGGLGFGEEDADFFAA